MREERDIAFTRALLSSTRHWNGGLGLIVPPFAGKMLLEKGFKEGEGFTITKLVPTTSEKIRGIEMNFIIHDELA